MYVHFLAVDPSARGKGVGRLLMAEAFRLADEQGVRTTLLNPKEMNVSRALHFCCLSSLYISWRVAVIQQHNTGAARDRDDATRLRSRAERVYVLMFSWQSMAGWASSKLAKPRSLRPTASTLYGQCTENPGNLPETGKPTRRRISYSREAPQSRSGACDTSVQEHRHLLADQCMPP